MKDYGDGLLKLCLKVKSGIMALTSKDVNKNER